MKKYVKWGSILVALIFVLSLAAACTTPTPTPTAAPAPVTVTAQAPAPVTVTAAPTSKVIELKFGYYSPPRHPHVLGVHLPWAKIIEDETKGAVKIVNFPAESLFKQADTIDAIAGGIGDIAMGFVQADPGRLPLTNFVTLPFAPWGTSGEKGAEVEWGLAEQGFFNKEFSDVKLLMLYCTSPQIVFTTKPVRTLEDMKGLKIRAVGTGLAKTAEALGAVAVTVPTAEMYSALEKGVIDGTFYTFEGVPGRKLYEVTPYAIDVPVVLGNFYFIMNLKTWNSLSADIQKVIESASGAWGSKWAGGIMDNLDQTARNSVMSEFKEVIKPAPDEIARWQAATASVWDWWIADMEGKGLPAQKLIDAANLLNK